MRCLCAFGSVYFMALFLSRGPRGVRLLPAALCCAVLLSGCSLFGGSLIASVKGVSSEQTESPSVSSVEEEPDEEADLFYIAVSRDGFNPYLSTSTLVEQVGGLVFEKLIEITPDMDLDYRLVQSMRNDELTVTLYLRSDCCFADGSPITAEDVAASVEAARASARYAERLANVTSVDVIGSYLVLTLAQPDSLFAYLLDLPVLKADEVALACPTASGRYTYGSGDGASVETLVPNPYAPFPEDGPDVIYLTTVSNYNELVSGLAMGTVSFYLADGGASGTIASSETYFRDNQLIFLGVNASSSNPLCSHASGRQLLSSLLSRRSLASKYSSVSAATGALNGLYPCVRSASAQTIPSEADASSLTSVMAALGYLYNSETSRYENSGGDAAAVDILVYSGSTNRLYMATLLQQQWASYGIEVTVTEAEDFETYLRSIQNQQFELYIGEMKLYNNMDLSPFWSGAARYGLAPSETLLAAYRAFRADADNAGEFEQAFAAEFPYIPLLWHGGVTVSSRRVSGVETSVSNLYYSLSQLTVLR
jgi:peptide/nickel transport system substrate-binding protein